VEDILDRENKRMADSLASKVTRLKSVSGGPLPFREILWWVGLRGEEGGRVLSVGIADWRSASGNNLAFFLAFSGNRYFSESWVKCSWSEGKVGTTLCGFA
jgi:hypothetical protein